ncbi:amidohydrolase [Mangrovactinospora gilvigrisea]|uniref:Amidohydrolase n=1 Tax=Mangrovactinospora gilvigrisea TaxID=1428644 RepID=A0A1J7BS59_9ACTN|nr:amidohydrolase [Mangrovactinospora gilvigrisea]OIV36297.1 amidohydrolase [Mangrovactinospora gilvigrisea]
MPEALAELAFVNGRVFTADAARSHADAAAVRGGRIAAVGAAAVRPLLGPRTRIVDLGGRLLLPGFVDAHVHPVLGGLERARLDLTPAADAADCLRRIAAHAAAHPELPWILGGGWSMNHFDAGLPTAAALDAAVPDRPAFLLNRDHHDGWANTRALDAAGIRHDTPDPAGGRIARDPLGVLHEDATLLVADRAPGPTAAELLEALLDGQRYLHSVGVTGWHDAIVGPYLGYPDLLPVYLDAARGGLLTGRAGGALWWDRTRGTEQIAELTERRAAAEEAARASGGRLRIRTVKIMQDGTCESRTAAMLAPYSGTADLGHSHLAADALADAVTALDAAGFQLHVHAIGDRGVREALDAFAAARAANGPSPHRHHIAHVQVVHPDDVPRFRELDVAANIQALWAAEDGPMRALVRPLLGPERAAQQYPFEALRAGGAVLGAGSDWPVTTADPMQAVHVAVNRTPPGEPEAPPMLPGQRLALGDALAAYTIGSTWLAHAEAETGSVEPGKAADLVMLDRDPFAAPPEEIHRARAVAAWVDGRPVSPG